MPAKVLKIIGFLKHFRLKYLTTLVIALFMVQSLFGFAQTERTGNSTLAKAALMASDSLTPQVNLIDTLKSSQLLRENRRNKISSNQVESTEASTQQSAPKTQESPAAQKAMRRGGLNQVVEGKNTDSLYYDMVNRKVYIYNKGDIKYGDKSLQADYMRINMNNNEIYAYGKADTVDGKPTQTQPVFTDAGTSFTMDTITYNFDSEKALIRGVATQQGDGWLVGGRIKKHPDNSINIQQGKYTTCDHTDHPHFYLAMTKAKVIPGKKIITGPAYLVMEDVPIYPLCIPEAFFPISQGAKSGLLMPTYGEDGMRGFFLRGLGYYFIINQHMDLAVTGGFYTLGSWEVNASSRYVKRYKYSGNVNFDFSCVKTGDKGEADYVKQNNFKFTWTHSQDPKANPGSTFSASVNLSTSGYSKYSANTLNDILATQTNSSISYSKSWAGTPFSFSINMGISQNSQTRAISVRMLYNMIPDTVTLWRSTAAVTDLSQETTISIRCLMRV